MKKNHPNFSNRKHPPAGLEQRVSSVDVGLEHALVQEERAHRLADEHVGAVARERRALDPRADDGDPLPSSASSAASSAAAVSVAADVTAAAAPVGLAQPPGVLRHLAGLDGVHALGPSLRGEQRKDAAPRSDVDDDLALEVGLFFVCEKERRKFFFFSSSGLFS